MVLSVSPMYSQHVPTCPKCCSVSNFLQRVRHVLDTCTSPLERYFVYDDFKHSCVEGNHVINLFSFSKAYGMMGWRVGYKQDVNGSEVKSKALPETKNSLVRPFHLFEVVCWFARRHGVLLLPGFACGTSGCIRITYGMLTESECNVAAKRHERGGRAHQRGHGGE
ncbi:hypothetical protein TEA_005699 [Camellia sinensis var. sinensis]|uniref:Aminotransferase class I/classII large domain-containing protein n=1 Tax=Camellia sinensis var. sinensis TaxID=542762 RepID=A0A4S4DJH3_CAMSN|nr:hypothetical protein TEA_005699 [Camellia sinensis var. sinensis]